MGHRLIGPNAVSAAGLDDTFIAYAFAIFLSKKEYGNIGLSKVICMITMN